MSRENEEDVSGIDDIFDDNKDNINKFPKSDETSKSDSDTIVDQEENELEQDTIQESNGTTEKGDGQEEEGGGEEEGGESNPSSSGTSTSTTRRRQLQPLPPQSTQQQVKRVAAAVPHLLL